MSRKQKHIGVQEHHPMFYRSHAIELQCISFHAFLCNGDVSVAGNGEVINVYFVDM